MEEQFFMGMKKDLYRLLRQMVVVFSCLALIGTILVNVLFSYYEHYVARQDERIIFEVRTPEK